MMVVVSYDINTESKSGQRRLRHVAKICLDYGQRVQNSVFECKVNSMQLELMKERLLDEIDDSQDSLYFFNLGKNYKNRIKSYGIKDVINLESPVIF